jgi:hypothetical protein
VVNAKIFFINRRFVTNLKDDKISIKFLAVDEQSRSIDFDNISKMFITVSYFLRIIEIALSCNVQQVEEKLLF